MAGAWLPYIKVAEQQFVNSLSRLMTFRVNFVLSILLDISSFITFYYTADVLFMHISHIGTWRREHFLFFIFWMQSLSCIHAIFMAPNFWNFAAEIRNGTLDFRLLRPLGSLFDIFMAIMRPISLLFLPVLVGCLIHYGNILNFPWYCWLAMPFLWFVSLTLVVSLEILISMGLFWTHGGDGIHYIRMQTQQFQRWPDFVYPETIRFIFTRVFPLLSAGLFPVRALFREGRWWEIPFLLIAIVVVWIIIGRLWSIGVRRYESVTS